MIRIEPLNPPPPVNFVEWDGMVRLCFNRKNKTLGAIFRQKPIVQLLYDNYKTYLALRGGGGGAVVELSEVSRLVSSVLSSTELSEARSSKLEQDDFLRLLAAFNASGIHFSN